MRRRAVHAGILAALAVATLALAGLPGRPATAAAAEPMKLSVPVPAETKTRGKLFVGVKCDYPPFGFIDENGKNAGYEIDVVRHMAEYAFGNPDAVSLTCVTGSNRTPYLTTKKIDLIVATMSYTPDRAKIISFSTPYFNSGVRLLVKKDSPITSEAQLKGKSVITISGTTASIWFTKCMPGVHQILYKETSEALSALLQGRGPAFAQDDTLLAELALKNSSLKVVGAAEASSPWGMGVRLHDTAMLKWTNAALAAMQKDDFFWKDFQHWVTDKSLQAQFQQFVPRPGHSLEYEQGSIFTCG